MKLIDECQKRFPPPEQQLVEMEKLKQEATICLSSVREAVERTAKAVKVAQEAEVKLLEAGGDAAEVTAVTSVADSVVATADWIVETSVRAGKANPVVLKAIQTAPTVDPGFSEAKRQELHKRSMIVWSEAEAKTWAAQVMKAATTVKVQSANVSKEEANMQITQLMQALAYGEDVAQETLCMVERSLNSLTLQTGAVRRVVQKAQAKCAEEAAKSRERAESQEKLEEAAAAAESVAAGLILEEETEKASAQGKRNTAGSRFRATKGSITKLFAHTAGDGISITTAALMGLFIGSTITAVLLRKPNYNFFHGSKSVWSQAGPSLVSDPRSV